MAGDSLWASVSLLLHGNGVNDSTTFTDNSPTPKTATAVGNAKISTAQSKFGGASITFDGTGDAVTFPSSSDFDMASGDFTIEAWVSCTSFAAQRGLVTKRATTGLYGPYLLYIDQTTGKAGFQSSQNGSSWAVDILAASGIALNTWAHIAVTRLGNLYTLWVDGVSAATATVAGAHTTNATAVSVGAGAADGGLSMSGYIDDLRITKGVGSCRYTGTFTPPATAHPDGKGQVSGTVLDSTSAGAARIVRAYHRDTGALVKEIYTQAGDAHYSNVSLLLDGDGASGSTTITDSSASRKTATVGGSAQTVSSPKKHGQGALFFSGAGAYLSYAASPDFAFGTGDFTIELWMYASGAGDHADQHVLQTRDGTNNGLLLQYNRTNKTLALISDTGISGVISASNAITDATWHHVAATRSGTSIKLFIDGVQVGSTVSSAQNVNATTLFVSRRYASDGSFHYFNGYLDGIRLTKAARYTTAFTPPTERHPDRASASVGSYSFYTSTLDELMLVCLDDAAGTLENDLVIRVTPA
jgi:hypothetical protein